MTQGRREREYWPQLLTDLRLWSMHSLLLHHHTHTHTHKHTFTFIRSPLISPSHREKPSLFSPLSIPIFHILFPPPPPPPSSIHVRLDLAICLLRVTHTHTHGRTHPPMTVHLRTSDCVNLSHCHATLQFAILSDRILLIGPHTCHSSSLSPSCPISTSPYENSFSDTSPTLSFLLRISLPPFFHYHTSSNTYISPALHSLNTIPTSHFTFFSPFIPSAFIAHTNQGYGLLCCDQ